MSYSSPVYITVSETHAVLFGEPVLIICSREPEQKSSDHDYIRLDNRWEEDGVTLEQRSEKMRSRTGSIKANKLFTERVAWEQWQPSVSRETEHWSLLRPRRATAPSPGALFTVLQCFFLLLF